MNHQEREYLPVSILSMKLAGEQDIVNARQRAREMASLLGFAGLDQVRIATAVSEIARNVHQYAKEGTLDFSIDLNSHPQVLWMSVSDSGPGVSNLRAVLNGKYESQTGMGVGISGTRRLMDCFQLESEAGKRTTVRFAKRIPASAPRIGRSDIGTMSHQLAKQANSDALVELQRQNRDLLQTLETLRLREMELEKREQELSSLNIELAETNRGVVALYGELDEKAAALRVADDMKSRFLWHVSHEFRTPLNAIEALGRLLLERADGPLLTEQEKQVTYIRQAAAELTEMVNDLLDLAKVQSGKVELRRLRLSVSELLGGVRGLIRPLATNEATKLVFEEPEQPLWIISDESKISQIVRNLISNALKFTQIGSVTVSAHLTDNGTAVAFAVKDTGIGIAPEDLDRIFQEFEQVENPVQRNVKGTGLGLSLSRKLATLLSGRLEVGSVPGAGSCFTLTVPIDASRGAASERPEGAEICGPNGDHAGTILLIDDDHASRYIARQLLAGTRHRIIEAENGIEGSERARFEKPVLIFLDLSMPDRSGFEILEEFKSNPATADIPVVIYSSKKLSATDHATLANRVLAILPKGGADRKEAFLAIRQAINEPGLFAAEPEFLKGDG